MEPRHYRVVYSFKDSPDGAEPVSGLIEDAAGNLYGTTLVGGTGSGTVFKIDPNGNETVLHAFNGKDGYFPFGGLIIDPDGNLYGTTNGGGSAGFGVVFKIDTSGQETTLHNFIGSDGANPLSALTRDFRGSLYGTSYAGGTKNSGVAFKIDRSGVFTVIHNFDGTDGLSPYSPLLLVSGRLYGTTYFGGSLGGGVVFTMDLSGNETVLYNFGKPPTGRHPADALVRDQVGNLYGTTEGGGDRSSCTGGCGVVYKLDTNGNETVLHKFIGLDGRSGRGLIKDAGGNLYGTTYAGGRYDLGVLYTLSPTGAFRVRYNFGSSNGGDRPFSSLVRDSKRNLFGTTSTGGQYGRGVVFEFTP